MSRWGTGCVLFVAAAAVVAGQGVPIEESLLRLDHAAAVELAAQRQDEVKAALDRLRERFDQSVRSARDVPEQRKVQYDVAALDQGLALGRIYADVTGDTHPLRSFTARQRRIEGTVLLNERKPAEAVAVLTDALRQAEQLQDLWLQIITRTNLAYGHLELGDNAAALAECERANALAQQADLRSRALTLFNLSAMQMHLSRFDDAARWATLAAEAARQVGNRLWEGNALLNLGLADLRRGRVEEARGALTQARDVLLKTQDKLGLGRTYYSLALVSEELDDQAAGVIDLELALPIVRSLDIRHSHDIEADATEYYNDILESVLRLLVSWHGKLGHADQARTYSVELEALLAKKPADTGRHVHETSAPH